MSVAQDRSPSWKHHSGFLYSKAYLTDLSGKQPPVLHPRFQEMRRYLERVRPEGSLPGRQHIDPIDFPKLLPLINLVDVERSGEQRRFRFRLIGTAQTEMAGRDVTGMLVEKAVLPSQVRRIIANMERAAETGMPVYDRFPMPHPDRQFIQSERMYFPLATDGKIVDLLLILNGYL